MSKHQENFFASQMPDLTGERETDLKKILSEIKEKKDYGQISRLIEAVMPEGWELAPKDLAEFEEENHRRRLAYWRGTNPVDIIKLLSGKESLTLDSAFANVADNWQKSIAYGLPDIHSPEGQGIRFNAAVGFVPSKMVLEGRGVSLAEQKDFAQQVVEVEKGNYRGLGEIELADTKYLMLRRHRDVSAKEKEMPAPQLFMIKKIQDKELAA